ncbi:MAG: zinc-dependent alcohol dehydrogenase [Acidimicrobiales bacterium]
MRALVKQGSRVRLSHLPLPGVGPLDVLVRVQAAGLCRTDVYVARGLIDCPDPLILGHEFAGVVIDTGPEVDSVSPGERVAVMPMIPCRACPLCAAGESTCCPYHQFLGVQRDGAFAEFISVPSHVVFPLPASLSVVHGAYAEPLAASLAVLKANILPGQRGLVYGVDRIAQLTARVLRAHGFDSLELYDPTVDEPLPADAYDFVVETQASSAALEAVIRAVRPRGRIILKSRPPAPVAIDITAALRKEIVFETLAYGSFSAAIELLADGRIEVSDLMGELHPLEDFETVFAQELQGRRSKPLFYMGAQAPAP